MLSCPEVLPTLGYLPLGGVGLLALGRRPPDLGHRDQLSTDWWTHGSQGLCGTMRKRFPPSQKLEVERREGLKLVLAFPSQGERPPGSAGRTEASQEVERI